MVRKTLIACVAAALIPAAAHAQEVKLRLAHFMPAASWQHTEMFEAWGKAVQEQSKGRIEVRVFPAQTLGKAVAGYDNAVNRVAEVTWTVQGYTANRFPLSQLAELPGIFTTAAQGSCAFQKLYDSGALADEYKDSHVLYVHTHGLGHLHTRDKPVTRVAEVKGMKIRQPTPVIGRMLRAVGAEPVGMPAPQIYETTQRGAIDGFLLPWEAVAGFRADEVSNHHTELGVYSLAFVLTMNKQVYQGLPPDLKKVIDDNSGARWAAVAGRGYDNADVSGRKKTLDSGKLHSLTPEDRKAWEKAGAEAADSYVAELEAKGLPARKVLAQLRQYAQECGK